MLTESEFDIDAFLLNNNPAVRKSDKTLPRTPVFELTLSKSVESLQEFEIPSSPLEHDPEISRLMSPGRSQRQPRQDVVSTTYTLTPRSPTFYLPSDEDYFESIYDDFGSEVSQLCQSQNDPCIQTLRRESLLPAPPFDLRWKVIDNTTIYSAPLRASLPSHRPTNLRRTPTISENFLPPLQEQNSSSEVYDRFYSDEVSRCSSEARPITPTSSIVPSLSFASTESRSPSSIMTYASTSDVAQCYGTTEHVEQIKNKRSRVRPNQLALRDIEPGANTRARKISSPNPSPQFPNVNTAAAYQYHRTPSSGSYAPTPSPAPTLINEVSAFDFDSDDDEGTISNRLKSVKSTMSLQNLRKTRIRAAPASRTPPLPSVSIITNDRASDISRQLNSKGSIKPLSGDYGKICESPTVAFATPFSLPAQRDDNYDNAPESYHSATSGHERASSEAKSRSPVTRLQKKVSIRSQRSDTVGTISTPPSPPPNTPVTETPMSVSTLVRRQSRMSFYSCFSIADNIEAETHSTMHQIKRRSKKRNMVVRPNKIRVLMRRVFRLKK